MRPRPVVVDDPLPLPEERLDERVDEPLEPDDELDERDERVVVPLLPLDDERDCVAGVALPGDDVLFDGVAESVRVRGVDVPVLVPEPEPPGRVELPPVAGVDVPEPLPPGRVVTEPDEPDEPEDPEPDGCVELLP